MKILCLFLMVCGLAVISGCSQGNQETGTEVTENGLATVTLQVSGMT